jgi:uncharacterized protein YndB with AHSA1/START domain
MSMLETRGFEVVALGDREIRGTRYFGAPRDLVWQAWTRPELVRRWLLGPDGWTMTVCEMDLRVGGAYRYVWHKEKGDITMGMGGVFLEIDPPARMVTTEKFDEAWYPGGMVATLVLKEEEGRTFMVQTFRYDTREARDMVIKSPMEEGMVAGYNRLDDVLAGLGKTPAWR